ncbi:MAG: PH domain-containing protein [Trebonia sp.]
MGRDTSLAMGEEPVAKLHPHWSTLVGPIATAILVFAAVGAAEAFIPGSSFAWILRLVVAVVAIALLVWWLLIPLLVWRTTVYELTTGRLRLRDGIITRNGRDIPLSRITDVSFTKSLLDRLLGAGTLIVESAGEHGTLTLKQIPRVEKVQAALFQLVEDERQRESGLAPAGDVDDGDYDDGRR